MARFDFVQMDVFSREPGMGNALAVVLRGHTLSDRAMQSLARWMRLPETTFTGPADDTGKAPASCYAIRMFAPDKEVPFAGHPSVGTAAALLDADLLTPDADGLVWQQGLAGLLPLRVEHLQNPNQRVISLRNPPANEIEGGAVTHRDQLTAATTGLAPGAMAPVLAEGGRRWWLVQAASEAALRQWSPAWDGIVELAVASGSMGICAFAFADDADSGYQVVTRALVGHPQPFEDAASGAANAILASILFRHAAEHLPATGYIVSQGREIGYDAQLYLSPGADGAIWSGGQTRTAIRGSIDWDAAAP